MKRKKVVWGKKEVVAEVAEEEEDEDEEEEDEEAEAEAKKGCSTCCLPKGDKQEKASLTRCG